MLEIKFSRQFKTSFKRVSQHKKFKQETFEYVVFTLASKLTLPEKYRDHALSGEHNDVRECHLAPDILLMYRFEEHVLVLTLLDIGSHSTLFGK